MPLVIDEMVDLAEAIGAVVSLYRKDGGSALLHVSAGLPASVGDDPLSYLQSSGADAFANGECPAFKWAEGGAGADQGVVLMLSVDPGMDRDRLVISLIFDRPTEAVRHAAERRYGTPRALALRYFRLWQQERVSARRCIALEAAWDATDMGVILLSRSGSAIYRNEVAGRLLDAGDGMRIHRDSIQASEIGDSVKLQVALNHVIAANAISAGKSFQRSAPLIRLRRAIGRPLTAAVVPAEVMATQPGDVAAILYLFDPTLDTDRMLKPACSLFKLSPVETRLACSLAAGHSITRAAEMLRIKAQTARSYLKNIFLKTDTNRQTELLHLLLTNTVRVGPAISPEPF